MTFGKRLKELRLACGLTQAQLADKIKLSNANVCKYELDSLEPNLQTLRLLSKFFGVSIDYLLGDTDDRTGGSYWITLDELDELDEASIPEGAVIATKFDVKATPEMVEKLENKLKSLGVDYTYKIKAAPGGPPLSNNSQELLETTADFSDEEYDKLKEYAELLKLKRKS